MSSRGRKWAMGSDDVAAISSGLSRKRAARVDEKVVVVNCKLGASTMAGLDHMLEKNKD